MEAVRNMGAMMQVFKQGAGGPEETSTALKNFFSDLMRNEEKLKKITVKGKKAPIYIWDQKILKETGKKVIRPPVEIVNEIMVKSKGDPSKLRGIFDMQTLDGMRAVTSEWQRTERTQPNDS